MRTLASFLIIRALVISVIDGAEETGPMEEEWLRNHDAIMKLVSSGSEENIHICETESCRKYAKSVLNNMDITTPPCEDFYQFVCGNFQKHHPIPDGKSYVTTLGVVNNLVRQHLKEILTEKFSFNDPLSAQMAKIFYQSCMDEPQIENLGLKPLMKLAKPFGTWPVIDQNWSEANYSWEKQWSKLQVLTGLGGVISLTVFDDSMNSSRKVLWIDQPKPGLGKRHYYADGRNSTHIRTYLEYMIQRAVLFGANETNAEEQMQEILDLEYRILNISILGQYRTNQTEIYNMMTLAELKDQIPHIDWDGLLSEIQQIPDVSIPANAPIFNVVGLPYLRKLEYVLNNTAKRTLANYFMGRLMGAYVTYLPKKYQEPYNKFKKVFYGIDKQLPRWELCISVTESYMAWQLGRLYVEKYFRKEAKQEMDDLVNNLRTVMKGNLKKAPWMDRVTKKNALHKLEKMGQNIGYPDYTFNETKINNRFYNLPFSSLTFFENLMYIKQKKLEKAFLELMQPVDKTLWQTTPTVVNAFYSLTQNEIMFPAGILQFPVFSYDIPKYANYGGIGMIIGHEITHGYDDQGRQFGPRGNLKSWWHQLTMDRFFTKAKCFERQYTSIKDPTAKLHLNGIATLGENIADNGGVRIAFRAYKKWLKSNKMVAEPNLPGLEKFTNDQMFFIAFANGWCQAHKPEAIFNAIKNNRHSLGRYRVNVPLQNLPGFSKAFNCSKNSKMNKRKRCRVW